MTENKFKTQEDNNVDKEELEKNTKIKQLHRASWGIVLGIAGALLLLVATGTEDDRMKMDAERAKKELVSEKGSFAMMVSGMIALFGAIILSKDNQRN